MIFAKYPRFKGFLKYLIESATSYRICWHRRPDDPRSLAITFDDGPLPNTRNILQFLEQQQLKATFFMVGERMLTYPDLVQEVARRGHVIGSHGYRHIVMKHLSLVEFRAQVEKSFALIAEMAGSQPKLFRPPWGQVSPWQASWLLRQGIRLVFWSHQLAADQTRLIEPDKSFTNGGPIILLHDYDHFPDHSIVLPGNKLASRG